VRTGTIEQAACWSRGPRRGRITDSRHSGTVSSTVRVHRASWNVMKPRIQRVLTQ
jgi:hypothetical protein